MLGFTQMQGKNAYKFSTVIFNGIDQRLTIEALPVDIKPGEILV
jgi:hypothetical protein